MALPEFHMSQQAFDALKEDKPHIIEIEKQAAAIGYGTFQVKLEVRAGIVNKMTIIQTEETWLSPKVKQGR